MTSKPREKKPIEKIAKPTRPHEHQDAEQRIDPDQEQHEPEQDHHEHGNLPKRPGRPGGT